MKQWKKTIMAGVCAVTMLTTGSLWAEAASLNSSEDSKAIRIQKSHSYNILNSSNSSWIFNSSTQEVLENMKNILSYVRGDVRTELLLGPLFGSAGWILPIFPVQPEKPAGEEPGSAVDDVELPKPSPEPPVVTEPTAPVPTPIPTPAPTVPAKPEATETPAAAGTFDQKVVDLVNVERAKARLGNVQFDAELSAVAMDKAKDMVDKGYFSHQSPTYGSPFDMMDSYGIRYSYAGENIAKGQQTPEQVMNDWMNSSGHRQNIMNANFKSIGVAYYNGVWVQLFKG